MGHRSVFLLVLACAAAQAAQTTAGPPGPIASRPSDRERSAIVERFQAEQRECRQRFAVNACLDEARARHRQALAELQSRRQAHDEQYRRDRAAARMAAVERRAAERQSRPPPSPPAAESASAAPRAPRAAPARRDASARAEAAARASERAAAAAKLQQEIRSDQARIESRVARRAAQAKPAQPLPPPAPSAPSR